MSAGDGAAMVKVVETKLGLLVAQHDSVCGGCWAVEWVPEGCGSVPAYQWVNFQCSEGYGQVRRYCAECLREKLRLLW